MRDLLIAALNDPDRGERSQRKRNKAKAKREKRWAKVDNLLAQ